MNVGIRAFEQFTVAECMLMKYDGASCKKKLWKSLDGLSKILKDLDSPCSF